MDEYKGNRRLEMYRHMQSKAKVAQRRLENLSVDSPKMCTSWPLS